MRVTGNSDDAQPLTRCRPLWADMPRAFIGGTEVRGGSIGSDDYLVHYPYLGNQYPGSQPKRYAPALASHGYRGRPPR